MGPRRKISPNSEHFPSKYGGVHMELWYSVDFHALPLPRVQLWMHSDPCAVSWGRECPLVDTWLQTLLWGFPCHGVHGCWEHRPKGMGSLLSAFLRSHSSVRHTHGLKQHCPMMEIFSTYAAQCGSHQLPCTLCGRGDWGNDFCFTEVKIT